MKNKGNLIKDYDVCVECGIISPYDKKTHIDLRIGYIQGVGQACFQPKKCNRSYK